jgi:hypothetical protein
MSEREVNEDGVAVGKHEIAVFQDRNLAERTAPKEFGRLVRAPGEIDVHEFDRDAEHRQEELDPVAMARERVAVETNGPVFCGHGWLSLQRSRMDDDASILLFMESFNP